MFQPLSPERIAELLAQRSPERQDKALSYDDVQSQIKEVSFNELRNSVGELRTTLCTLTMPNGFEVRGESVVLDESNYNSELGQHYAYLAARNNLMPLCALLAKEAQHLASESSRLEEAAEALRECSHALAEYQRTSTTLREEELVRGLSDILNNEDILELMWGSDCPDDSAINCKGNS